MPDTAWLIRRLKAMSVPEVAWRVSQKLLQKKEECRFGRRKQPVTAGLFKRKLAALSLDADRMHLNPDNRLFSLNTEIPLLGGYDYAKYKEKWNAGFQTEREWPLEFSYSLGIGIGVLFFFNHFGHGKITKDPSPIEVQMRTYEEDVDKTLIADKNRRKGGKEQNT